MTVAVRRSPAAMRLLGAALAAGISLAIALLLAAVAATDVVSPLVARELIGFVALGAAIGIPVGAVLGWTMAPDVVAGHGRGRLVVRLATWAVALGAPPVALLMSVALDYRMTVAAGGLLDFGGIVLTAAGMVFGLAGFSLLYGLMLFGPPAWLLAAGVAALWIPIVSVVVGSGGRHPENGAAPERAEPDPAPSSGEAATLILGWLAVGATVAIAVALTWMRARSDSPPGMVAAGLLGFLAAFGGPGLVAAVGIARRRRGLLVAAAVVLICLSPLSMGGATLPFMIPAVILIYVAPRLAPSPPQSFASRVAALLAFCLIAAAPIALFATTEIVCWDDYGGGNVVTRVLPEMPNGETAIGGPFGGGCSSGSISSLGGSLAILAVAGAAAVAFRSGRRRT